MAVDYIFSGLRNFSKCINREWIITNHIGGFCSSSIIGAHNRLQQGYLVAPISSVSKRFLIFSKTNEKLVCKGRIFDLSTGIHKGELTSEVNIGNQFLNNFKYNGVPSYTYECGNITLTKTISLVAEKNSCVIHYEILNNGEDASLTITPSLNFRDIDTFISKEELMQELSYENIEELNGTKDTIGFYVTPTSVKNLQIQVACSEGKMLGRYHKYDENIQLSYELSQNNDAVDCNFAPIDFVIDIEAGAGKEVSFVCELIEQPQKSQALNISDIYAKRIIDDNCDYLNKLIKRAGFDDDFANSLVMSSDSFIYKRGKDKELDVISGYPYSVSDTRNTLIGFCGLFLRTKRYKKAKELLLSYTKRIKNGIMASALSGNGKNYKFDSVDAGLWYIYDVYEYLLHVDSQDAWDFVGQELYPYLQQILSAYRRGTDFSIRMDDDGLLNAGSSKKQLTWMNSDGIMRHGKAVEVNALWYNALMCMEFISRGLAKRGSEKAADYLAYAAGINDLSIWVKDSFLEVFWNDELGYLNDVVNSNGVDSSLRPNQIVAVSLPFNMLSLDQEKAMLKAVYENLYTPLGMRTLSLTDERYTPNQLYYGVAVSHLLGAFIRSYKKLYKEHFDEQKFFEPLCEQLSCGAIAGLGEYFDGKDNSVIGGSILDAATVGEILWSI